MSIDCARCFTPTASAYVVEFTYEGVPYEIDLCDKHIEMFDRDLLGWVRMSRESFPEALVSVAPLITRPPGPVVFPVADGGVTVIQDKPGPVRGEITPEAMEYTFTDHALVQMRARHLDRQDIFRALSSRHRATTREGLGAKWPGAEVWIVDQVKLVVNPKVRRVITVMWRTEEIAKERALNGSR